MPDYERVLYYTMWGHWDDLFNLMIRTKDDFLSKKIEKFLSAYHYSPNEDDILLKHEYLMQYIDHALTSQLITLKSDKFI